MQSAENLNLLPKNGLVRAVQSIKENSVQNAESREHKTMKNSKIIAAILMSATIFVAGCGGSETAEKALEQSKLSMASGDYTAALNYLKLAQDEGQLDEKSKETLQILDNYLKAEKEVAQHQTTKALEYLNAIPAAYANYSIAGDIEKLKQEIEKGTSSAANIEEQITAIRNWIASGDYASAALNITELLTKNLTAEQRKQADELKATLETAKAKISQAEQSAKSVAQTYQEISGNTNVIATYFVVNCQRSISLRSYPSTSANAITQIPLGQAVGYIEDAGNGFYKINYDGLVGYSLASYLSPSYDNGRNNYSGTSAQVVNCNEWISLRSYPSTSAPRLDRIPLGAYVTYYGTAENGFCDIEYHGQRGFALSQYLSVR